MSDNKEPLSKEERKAVINHIKDIITSYGSFNTAEVQSESSPVIATIGKDTCQLAEKFYSHKVEAVTYVNEQEVNTEMIYYEDLSDEILTEIDTLAKEYEKEQRK